MDKFEEYKLFVEDTARFTERRQTVTNIYVAVNSIILGAIAFLVKDLEFIDFWKVFVGVLVLVAGIFICLQWDRLIYKYKLLVGFRIRQLREMEESPEMSNCHRMYHVEDELYPRDKDGNDIPGKGLNISDRERLLPRVFITLYGVFLLSFFIRVFIHFVTRYVEFIFG